MYLWDFLEITKLEYVCINVHVLEKILKQDFDDLCI